MMWYQKKRLILAVSALLLIAIWALLANKPPQTLSADTLKYAWDMAKFSGMGSSNNVETNNNKRGHSCDRVFGDVFNTLTSGYRHCLIERIQKSAWTEMNSAISFCLGDALWRLLDVKQFENRDDIKLAILPPADLTPVGEFANCTEITLGIGRDIEAELLLRKVQPHCRFFGADPIKASGTVFQELGVYFELAVAAEAGVLQAKVLENGRYKTKDVPTITFVDFLTRYVNVTKVDYILIDNEGPEYPLFEQLLVGGNIEANGISLCQISVEMHGPLKDYGMNETKYNNLINSVLSKSSYLPIWSTVLTHTRAFYLNVGDPYCVGKYFRSKWCGNFEYYKSKTKS